MAVLSLDCGSDKENAPPPSAERGVAVKRQTMKRPGGARKAPRRRPPFRDITGLFVTAPCPPPSTAVLLAHSDAALPEAVRPGAGRASDGVTVKQGSHSLRMGFR
ncbi:unnamed protein product [Miscanthus lutarioriparius]|uniref:Uncharacterized protein n=1 Tax=Miscanthus lutarioriparius TaxID=422564 RepID=A0A811Q3S5_9POAL|nr:unnamed protein product [Miscanthus lutarioriparius]